MGGLLNLINFNQGGMARKFVKHKSNVSGLEAPRNSLELPIETSQSYVAAGESEPYTYQMKEDYFDKNHFQTGAEMKKLVSEEISEKPNTKHSVPSIVARLMGVDMLPIDAKPMVNQFEKKNEKPQDNYQNENWTKDGSGNYVSFDSKFSRHSKSNSFDNNVDRDPDLWIGSMNSKPRHQEHPQEKELQKFKKDFVAWQAARFSECTKAVQIDSIPCQWLGQENPNKEKLVLYANSRKMTTQAKPRELKSRTLKASPHERPDLEYPGCKNELAGHTLETNVCKKDSSQKRGGGNCVSFEHKESFSSRNRVQNMNFEQPHIMNSVPKLDASSAPSKIVILRPGPDRISYDEESWASSSHTSEERGSIEDFLEEVKERLKCELQGKSFRRGTIVRGGGIETPYREKPSDPKQIAQRIAKQVRDSVTRDIGMNLLRSESTRSYKSEIHLNGAASPEFISRDTRRFLSERLKNVLKSETRQNSPITLCGSSGSAILEYERDILQKSGDNLNVGNQINYSDNLKCEPDMQSRSFRYGPDDEVTTSKALSPRNLIRSLSAPVSGTSFGKLLLEDPHILTRAHIRRKHEAIEKVTLNAKKGMKEKLVSSFKYSFALKGRLFHRKIGSLEESHGNRGDFVRDIMSGPTVMTNFYDQHENSTEVPPSPASVCSNAQEDLWRPVECLSPISTNDVPSMEDDAMPQVFREISSNLKELRKQLNQLETGDPEETVNEQFFEAEMVELEDQVEAYIRDLLVASGFYDGSSDISISRWDPFAKPIGNHAFEEVEESYRQRTKGDEGFVKDQCEKVDHKVLFDLLNEALSTVLGPPVTLSRFMKKTISSTFPPLRGRKLLKVVWEIIRVHVYTPVDTSHYSVDCMVARNIQSAPWSQLLDDDTNSLGKELECQIIRDLMEEIVRDMQP